MSEVISRGEYTIYAYPDYVVVYTDFNEVCKVSPQGLVLSIRDGFDKSLRSVFENFDADWLWKNIKSRVLVRTLNIACGSDLEIEAIRGGKSHVIMTSKSTGETCRIDIDAEEVIYSSFKNYLFVEQLLFEIKMDKEKFRKLRPNHLVEVMLESA